jgi:hypothetical protein
MPPEERRAILDFYATHCEGYGPTLAAEVLDEEHGVKVHRETLRRFLHQEHIIVPRREARAHRRRRARREHFGSLVQIDGSFHRWFGPDGEECCLMVAIDDATGSSLMWMCREETTWDAFAILKKWIERYGVPEAIYVDRRNVYVTDREPTPEEKAQGSGALTDFGRACWKLGIRIIAAHSPQAKGRVERRNGLLQDRLVKALTRRGVRSIEQANAMLDGFAEELDRRFAIAPASPIDRHRRRPSARILRETLCWEKTRCVANDWTVACDSMTYQILRQAKAPAPGKEVTVRHLMDATVRIVYKEKRLRFRAAPDGINRLVTQPPRGGWASPTPSAASSSP